MKTKLNVSLLVLSAVLFQSSVLWAADLVKVDTNKKTVTSAVTDYGDSKQAAKDIVRATAQPKVDGVGLPLTAEVNPLPRPSVNVEPLPPNVAVSGGVCPQMYRCVVPHGNMLLATCLVRTGDPTESSSCRDIQPRCAEYDAVRIAGGTLGAAEGNYYDHNCKANL